MAGHRRVEPRTALAGTGMATDVDRVQDLEGDYERRARAWREAPERGFGEVLDQSPARGQLEEDEAQDPRRRPQRPPTAPSEVDMAKAAAASAAAEPPARELPARAAPRVRPDPRAVALHRQLEKQVLREPLRPRSGGDGAMPEPLRVGTGASETPPTGNPGSRARKP